MANIYDRGREETWEKLQEKLQKARKKQSSSRQNTASSTRSYAGKVSPSYRNGYHRTPPPKHLPQLDTPPGHNTPSIDTPVSGYPGNLRRSTYEVVPPLVPREDAFEREPSIDSHYSDYPRDRSSHYDPRYHRDYPDPIDQRNFLDPSDPRGYARHDPGKGKGRSNPGSYGYSNRSKQSSKYSGKPKGSYGSKTVANGYSRNPSHKTNGVAEPDDLYSSLRYNGFQPSILGIYRYPKTKRRENCL
ncbi:uncharacterized protein [Ptychodera flava]|uniref:uncharacterized protein n=1 Tax=Ptychodera flava TaxID=63121 RepID=UPI00396A0D6A